MAKPKMDSYRQELLALRTRLSGDISHLANEALHLNRQDSSNDISSMPIHMADVGTDNYEQENTLSLLANEEHVLEEIAAALDRLDDGTFGACEECSSGIPKARLEVLPYARYCVACARKREQRS